MPNIPINGMNDKTCINFIYIPPSSFWAIEILTNVGVPFLQIVNSLMEQSSSLLTIGIQQKTVKNELESFYSLC